jgi:cytochrome c-type biogenesis protein CcmH/NrfF
VRRARPAVLVVAALLCIGGGVLPAAGGAALAATPQTSASEIEAEVMCPVCGTLLELAESPQAQREKVFVKRLVAEGKSKTEIKDTLVAEYGQEVLALPSDSGFNLSAYLVPIAAFAIAVVALGLAVMQWRRDGMPPGGNGSARSAGGPSEEDTKRLDADLARYDL